MNDRVGHELHLLRLGLELFARSDQGAGASVPAGNGAAKARPGSISVEEIAAVKKLVDQLGADKVEQLARVLAK